MDILGLSKSKPVFLNTVLLSSIINLFRKSHFFFVILRLYIFDLWIRFLNILISRCLFKIQY